MGRGELSRKYIKSHTQTHIIHVGHGYFMAEYTQKRSRCWNMAGLRAAKKIKKITWTKFHSGHRLWKHLCLTIHVLNTLQVCFISLFETSCWQLLSLFSHPATHTHRVPGRPQWINSPWCFLPRSHGAVLTDSDRQLTRPKPGRKISHGTAYRDKEDR